MLQTRFANVGAACCAVLVVLLGCTTYRDNLSRGERLYQENEFEDSLALCRLMERDVDALTRTEQARYAFLRGMTDYRLGFRSDARHWLAIAQAIHEQEVGGLDADAQAAVKTTLDELNREVYGLVPIDSDSTGTEHADDDAPEGASPPAEPAKAAEEVCGVDVDCPTGQLCVAERCTSP
jgi:hypothetical protein